MTIADRIERTIALPVSRERVWHAITRPEHLSHWLSMVSEIDFRVGGEIQFTWADKRSPYPGIIETIEPLHRFAFRWSSHAIGHPELDLAPGASTLVTFILEEVAGGTQLTLVESGFASLPAPLATQTSQDNQHGWQTVLNELCTYLQGQVATS